MDSAFLRVGSFGVNPFNMYKQNARTSDTGRALFLSPFSEKSFPNMRLLLAFILTLFLTVQTVAQEFQIIRLADILNPIERNWLDNTFPRVDIGRIQLVVIPGDGPGKVIAHVELNEDYPSDLIFLDGFDWHGVALYPGVMMARPIIAKVLIHELIHVDQTERGQAQRALMVHQCRTLPYSDRPFEIEAYSVSEMLVRRFPHW